MFCYFDFISQPVFRLGKIFLVKVFFCLLIYNVLANRLYSEIFFPVFLHTGLFLHAELLFPTQDILSI